LDVESGQELLSDAQATRDDFVARFADARRALASRLNACGILHQEYFLDQPLDAPLRRLFTPGKARFQEGV
jgi:uncharacterized protein (DUF58 family)